MRHTLLLLCKKGGLVSFDEAFDRLAKDAQSLDFIKSILERIIEVLVSRAIRFPIHIAAVEGVVRRARMLEKL